MVRTLWVFLKRDAAIEASYRAALLAQLSGVVFWVAFFGAAGQLVGGTATGLLARYGGSYANFALLGVAFGGYLQTGLISFPQRLREAQLMGTLEATLMSPVAPATFVLGVGLWDHVITSVRVLVYLLCGALFFALDLRQANLAGTLAVLALAIVAFDALGMISAGLVLVAQRGLSIAPLLATITGLLSGVYFPIELLPPAVRSLALLLPSTHALIGLRLALLRGAAWAELLPSIGALALFDILLVPCAALTVRWAMRHALTQGTLGHY
ncbi:MAG TPA: ABC transporter permease [Roseiflexaceae bacterium]